MTTRGRFITLEGGEGAGKSTALEFMRDWLSKHGHSVLATREPGGTPLGERVREVLLHAKEIEISPDTEVLLMFAARAQHLNQIVRPALQKGLTVLCDRFTDATYAYQGGGHGVPMTRIAAMEAWVQGDFHPDLTLLFDIPVTAGLMRAAGRNTGAPDRFESREQDFLERVRQTYLERARHEPSRIKVIDASRPIDDVQKNISAILERTIGGKL